MGSSVLKTWLNFHFLTQHRGATCLENQGWKKSCHPIINLLQNDSERFAEESSTSDKRTKLYWFHGATTHTMFSIGGTTKFSAAKWLWHCNKVANGRRLKEKWSTVRRKFLKVHRSHFSCVSLKAVGGASVSRLYSHHVRSFFGSDFLLKPSRWFETVKIQCFLPVYNHSEIKELRWVICSLGMPLLFILWRNFPRGAAMIFKDPADWLKVHQHLYGPSWRRWPSRCSWESEITSPHFFSSIQSKYLFEGQQIKWWEVISSSFLSWLQSQRTCSASEIRVFGTSVK